MLSIFYLILYLLVITSPLIIILLTGPFTDHGILYELGKAFALMGFLIIAMQFVLSSRRKWIERPFGLDMIFSYHKAMAVLAGLLIASHPILLAIGSGDLQLITSLSLPWYILLGKVILLFVLVQIIVSVLRKTFHIGFEKWRLSHNLIGGILIVGIFVHSLIASHADLNLDAVLYLWIGIPVIGLAFYAHHKFIVPARLKKHPYTITDVRQETHNVWTLEMSPPDDERRYQYHPGQFHFITLHRDRDLPKEEHHFTISSSPTQPSIVTSSIKESGDFTSTIGKTKKGDTVSVEAPFGRFSYLFHPEDKNFVFIAGGIGITPLMSMLRDMRDSTSEANVLLIYANHSQDDIVFRQELDEIVAGNYPKLKVVHVLDHPSVEWEGETGYVDQDKLHKLIENFQDKAFYICCPPAMRKIVLNSLKKMGVKNNQVRVEIFSL
mgnify:CR=1 FL=1